MTIPFFNRLPLKKIVVPATGPPGRHAEQLLAGIVRELPDVLLAYVFDNQAGALLAFYTVSAHYNPHQLSLRNAKLLRTMQEALAARAWTGQALTDVSVLLDDQVHHLRPLAGGTHYCFTATRLADANLGLLKEVVRRCTIQSEGHF